MNSDVQDHHPSVPHESHAARVRGTGHQSIPSNSTASTVNESMVPFKLEPTDTTTTRPPNGGLDDTDTDNPRLPEPSVLERVPTILQPSIPWRKRLMHFTFAWYTVTLSTSGISLVLATTPHRFRGLSTIGLVIFLLDLLFFLVITGSITLRFVLYELTFRRAFTRPNEALFVPTFFLSIAAILCNVAEYARIFIFDDDISYRFNTSHSSTSTSHSVVPWLSNSTLTNSTLSSGLVGTPSEEPDDSSAPSASLTSFRTFLCIAFWLFSAVTFLASVIQYHLLFTVKAERRLSLTTITPAWVLPIFPVMLIGTLAGSFSKTQDPESAIGIICAGLAAQGLGLLVSFFFFSSYLSRLMAFGLPAQRPGMFIAVGPPSFTGAAVISMASDIPRVFDQLRQLQDTSQITILTGVGSTDTLAAGVKLSAIWLGVFLWGLGFWFFVSAVAGIVAGMPDKKFHLSWWSIVFPNVGFTIASIKIGQGLGSEGVLWMGSGLTVALVLAWAFIGYRCVRAVVRREIVWPGHDEDS
ncbi:voltage-dependent anion channel-domain-containing protein [Pseudoneurospora amorphoporcata]|uniref:Voltage-dependent anion channel-domain-containing protein n=1 Tax=Pseudoneurospora amorphoporcata TaxID=241081 RepID=A0AAN6NRD2_9PEZI|nr:voltage-dependent anion channel-domain-containing protein [Pseudoneurospora amorphoporcata]